MYGQMVYTRYASFLLLLVSSAVMVGWWIQNSSVVQIHPSFAPMQFSTALGFFLLAVGIVSYKRYKIIGLVSALSVALLSLISCYGYLIEETIWLDTFFTEPFVATETAYPGRMAVNTAVAFLIASFSLLLSYKKVGKFSEAGGYLGLVVFGLGLTALIGYGLEIQQVYMWGKLTGMALHTCSSFILIGIALIFFNLQILDSSGISSRKSAYLFGFTLTLQFIFLLIDIVVPAGVSMGVIHVLGIVLMTFTYRKSYLLIGLIVSFANIFAGFLFTDGRLEQWTIHADRIISFVICLVVYSLCLDIIKKSQNLKEQNLNLDKEVAERTRELSARNKDLEQFAYICTHDLQEPLRTISSYSKIISETNRENLDELGKRSVDYVQSSTERMQKLIKALLDYARLGKNLNLDFVNTDKLIRSILLDLQQIIDEKEAVIKVKSLPSIECYKNEFRTLIQNLIINALKYQKEGKHPEVEIGYKNESLRHVFYVKDNGIGIDKNFQSRIFKLFQRLHLQTEIEGTGIGLAQCKKIAQLHQGDVWVDSAEGKGSTFYVSVSKKLKTHINYDQENFTDR